MTIDEILQPADVNLSLRADGKIAAIEEVLAQLRGDARVANWEELLRAPRARGGRILEHQGRSVCIAHGRTKAATALTMAAGRSAKGVVCAETASPVHLLFVVGIPAAMDSEYLRLVGAIARVCRDEEQMADLLAAADPESFVERLASSTERL